MLVVFAILIVNDYRSTFSNNSGPKPFIAAIRQSFFLFLLKKIIYSQRWKASDFIPYKLLLSRKKAGNSCTYAEIAGFTYKKLLHKCRSH